MKDIARNMVIACVINLTKLRIKSVSKDSNSKNLLSITIQTSTHCLPIFSDGTYTLINGGDDSKNLSNVH